MYFSISEDFEFIELFNSHALIRDIAIALVSLHSLPPTQQQQQQQCTLSTPKPHPPLHLHSSTIEMAAFIPWHTGYPVHVEVHPRKGRQMIATKNISPNEVLLADSPYCWVVDDSAKQFVCQNCFLEKDNELPDFIPCQDCNQVYYCSDECKSIDFLQHTQDECRILKAMETDEYSPAIITEMKLLVRTLSRKSVERLDIQGGMPNDNGLRYNDYAQLVSNRYYISPSFLLFLYTPHLIKLS